MVMQYHIGLFVKMLFTRNTKLYCTRCLDMKICDLHVTVRNTLASSHPQALLRRG